MSKQAVVVIEAERATLRETAKGRWRIQLIEADVQGSSGYYPAAVLERDIAKAFPAGTQIFVDHPTESEEYERPERSVRDLVGVLVRDAWYENGTDGHGGFGDVQVFPDFKESVQAWAPYVGMSIRAMGLRDENGTVTELIRGQSVDIVTRAGAGGRLVEMIEAARQSAGTQSDSELYTSLSEADRSALKKVFATMKKLTESVGTLHAEITELKEKAAELEKADVLTPGQIFSKLSTSGLPAVVTARLADGYKKGMDLDAAIEQEKAVVAEITQSLQPAAPEANASEDAESAEPAPVQESAGVGLVQVAESDKRKNEDFSNVLTGIFGGVA